MSEASMTALAFRLVMRAVACSWKLSHRVEGSLPASAVKYSIQHLLGSVLRSSSSAASLEYCLGSQDEKAGGAGGGTA